MKKEYAVFAAVLAAFCIYEWLTYKTPEQQSHAKELTEQELGREFSRQRDIFNGIKSLIETSESMGEQKPVLDGKALVWDRSLVFDAVSSLSHFDDGRRSLSRDTLSEIQERLPKSLQAGVSTSDDSATVFILTKKDYDKCVQYGYSQTAPVPLGACRITYRMAVVYWPEKRAAGMVSVTGPDPPLHVSASAKPADLDRRQDEGAEQAVVDYISVLARAQ